jgi:MFS family permease
MTAAETIVAAEGRAEFDSFVAKNFRWNFWVNVMDLAFYMLAMNLVSQATVMPLLVSQLTDSKLAIGLIPAISSLGFMLPQLFAANFTERLRYKKPFVVLISSFGERGPFLYIGLVIWFLAVSNPQLTLILIFIFLAVWAVSAGVAMPAWSDLIAKVIPVQRRGVWSGTANGLGALMGVVGAWAAGRLLAGYPFAMNFALAFFLAFGAQIVSWIGLALNREPPGLVVKPHISQKEYFQQLPALLRRDANYVHYLISRSVGNLGGMSAGFLMVYGAERYGFGGAQVGLLTAVLAGSQAVFNLGWGVIADRVGHKLVLVAATFATMFATASALLIPSPMALYVAFVFYGAAMAAEQVSAPNIVLEFGTDANRPTYIGLTNTLLAPARTLAPIIGGVLATYAGYRGMFGVATVLAAVGGLLLLLWVREPRVLAPRRAEASV